MSALSTIFTTSSFTKREEEYGTFDDRSAIRFRFKGPLRDRLIALVNKVADYSPTGKAVLEHAADDFTLMFEEQESVGYASPSQCLLALNPKMTDDVLIAALIHECRHAAQFKNGCDTMQQANLDFRSRLILDRAMEADADACAAACCLEITQNTGTSEAWEGFRAKRPEVVAAVETELTKNPAASQDDVRRAAFSGWFDSNTQKKKYEGNYIMRPMSFVMMTDRWDAVSTYQNNVSPDVLLKTVGADYIRNPEVMNEDRYLDLDKETKARAEQFFKLREMRKGIPVDATLASLPVRTNRKKSREAKKIATPIMTRLISSRQNRQ